MIFKHVWKVIKVSFCRQLHTKHQKFSQYLLQLRIFKWVVEWQWTSHFSTRNVYRLRPSLQFQRQKFYPLSKLLNSYRHKIKSYRPRLQLYYETITKPDTAAHLRNIHIFRTYTHMRSGQHEFEEKEGYFKKISLLHFSLLLTTHQNELSLLLVSFNDKCHERRDHADKNARKKSKLPLMQLSSISPISPNHIWCPFFISKTKKPEAVSSPNYNLESSLFWCLSLFFSEPFPLFSFAATCRKNTGRVNRLTHMPPFCCFVHFSFHWLFFFIVA